MMFQGIRAPKATRQAKSFIACALAHQACRKGYRAGYRRASRLFHELTLARADGTYVRLLGKLARLDRLLGPRPRAGRGTPRPPRDPRGPLRHSLDHHHEPAPPGPVARLSRRRHPGRRRLRSAAPQRPPNCAKRNPHGERRPSSTTSGPAQRRSAPITMRRSERSPSSDLGVHDDRNAQLGGLLARGPVALSFFRGRW